MNDKDLIIIAHSGLNHTITQDECEKAIPNLSDYRQSVFIDFNISNARLSDLYILSYEQLALEQQRKFKTEIDNLLNKYSSPVIAYFGLAPIPLAIHLGYLCGTSCEYLLFQLHHQTKKWYLNTDPIKDYEFSIKESELPTKTEKGKGDVFIRVSTSFLIEPQHTYEVLSDPTNELDLTLKNPNVDGISSESEMELVINEVQKVFNAYANYLPDRDKIHLFVASTTAVAFAIGTKINPNVYPYIQTYQYARDETPKYKEAILITKRSDDAIAYSEEDKSKAAELRLQWSNQLENNIKPFIKNNTNTFHNWFENITQKEDELKVFNQGLWKNLPQLFDTSLSQDSIDLDTTTINDGFDYDKSNLKWKIDDGMFVCLSSRLSKIEEADIMQAGRLFLFHEALHYSIKGHNLVGEIANGIGQFPKVIEEADYQADVYAMLYDFKFSATFHYQNVENLKKFFLRAIDTATETMWSFVDNGSQLDELQIRSINRFLNWYWQWVRIEQLSGQGTLKEIIEILFEKPVIELGGTPPFILNQRRVAIKLKPNSSNKLELAVFHNNKIKRTSPTGMNNMIDGFRNMDGNKIKAGLRTFLTTVQ